MKEKIINALKTEYSNLGFSAKAIDGVAESLAATGLVTDENLESIIKGQKSALSAMQAEIDSRVTSAVEKAKAESNKDAIAANGGGQSKSEPEKPFDAESFKAELLKTIREEQAAAFMQAQRAAQRNATIASKAKEYGIPEKLAEKFNIAQDADLDDYFKNAKQELIDAGFEVSEPPMQGGGVPNNGNDIAKLIETGTNQIVQSQKK